MKLKLCLESDMMQYSYDGKSTLYLISTPIGNLEDMTYRSVKVLEEVSVIFSEDTRVTLNLLNYLGISKKLIALHEHNEDTMKEKVLEYLEEGKSVALVTDRGTPVISDPGFKTTEYIIKSGYNVVALPGATAFVPALITSGIAPQPFLFYGFLNSNDSKRKKELEELSDTKCTMIFYEAPHRILKTLKLMFDVFGDRNISISREITKKFESIYRGRISELSQMVPEKGEFVLIVEGNSSNNIDESLSEIETVNLYIKAGLSVMDAIKRVAKERNVSKSDIYNLYHKGE